MKKAILVILYIFITLPFLFSQEESSTREVILSYDATINVQTDATLIVGESIKVLANGDKIKHGIYRDFPTVTRDGLQFSRTARFEVLEVLCDGVREEYWTENLDNSKRLYIGKKSVQLVPGIYTFYIRYRTDAGLFFLNSKDQLYWNVTGNSWEFPIESVSASVYLPGNHVSATFHEAYSGIKGSKEKAYTYTTGLEKEPRFIASRPLNEGEGFTILLEWEKGLIKRPDRNTQVLNLIQSNPTEAGILGGLLLAFLYYLFAWFKVGRDPKKGVVMPEYQAPDNLSPAAVRFVHRMGYDTKVLTSVILNLAANGALSIHEDDGDLTLKMTEGFKGKLPPEEAKVLERLFEDKKSVRLSRTNRYTLLEVIAALFKMLKKNYENRYFKTNRAYMAPGIIISLLGIVGGFVFGVRSGEIVFVSLFMTIWLSGWTFGVVFLMKQVVSAWAAAFTGGSSALKVVGGFSAIGLTLFSIPFIGGEAFGIFMLTQFATPWFTGGLVSLIILNGWFFYLLKAPTVEGRRLLDRIEGFKLFLTVAEKDRLQKINPPQKDPQVFEKYLPFALALDVDKEWALYFKDSLDKALQNGNYSPSWYHGTSWGTLGTVGFASALSGGIAGSLSSATTTSSSSSSSGGGSSGGGGGGGGGGGW